MEQINVFIVDSEDIMRKGLVELLSKDKNIEVLGSASKGDDVIELIDKKPPDIMLIDLRMQNVNGVELIKKVTKKHPDIRCIIFTRYDEFDEEYIFDSIKAGAKGYLLKKIPFSELIKAIKTIYGGGTLLSPKIAKSVFNRFRELAEGKHTGSMELSDREKEVVKLIAQGLSNKRIAGKLFISTKTVKTHVANIMEKLDVSNRTEAVVSSIRKGLIDIEE
jgi:DNA-binding NarL/FixJ family response regulator